MREITLEDLLKFVFTAIINKASFKQVSGLWHKDCNTKLKK